MTDEQRPGGETERSPVVDDSLAGLLKACGRRPQPSPEARARVFHTAHGAWRAVVHRRRRRANLLLSAAAAAFAMVAFLVVWRTLPPPHAEFPVAFIDRVLGDVLVRRPGGDWHPLTPAAGLQPGTTLRTAPGGGIGLRLPGGASLRLAENTEASLIAAQLVGLARGAAYVDAQTGADKLEIRTAAGVVRNLGTQFELRYEQSTLRLSVRQGAVLLQGLDREIRAEAGQRLTLDASGHLQRETIPSYDSDWAWVQDLAPSPDLQNLPLLQFLSWVERETGREVHFAQPRVEARARETFLHGRPGRFTPMDALAVMLATTDFRYVAGEDVILIEEAEP